MSETKKEIPTGIPSIYLSDLEKLAKKIRSITEQEDAEIGFEFMIATLFPTSWKNIQDTLSQQYIKGYIQGQADKEKELKCSFRRVTKEDEDPDCYCE